MLMTVNTSKRPASIRKESTVLVKSPASATFETYLPIPGPELLTQDTAMLTLESKLLPSRVISMAPETIRNTYRTQNARI